MPNARIQTLVFDWGDTVMRNLEYDGPMAHWPRVEAVPGINEVLPSLQAHYRLILTTNAVDSGAALVREALRRVDLEQYFTVFTAKELGVRKPDPAFFLALLDELGLSATEVAMVGDAYGADVIGAKQIGMRAIWFNPQAAPCPLVHPLHDAEVRSLSEISAALAHLPPDIAECMAMLAEQEAPRELIRHTETVAAIAFLLAEQLAQQGQTVHPLRTHRGGLLHDLDKISARRQKRTHGELGAHILREKGYPELADIVARHPIFVVDDPAGRPRTWEEKLVHYADKLVEDDCIVSVQERVEGLAARHPDKAKLLHGYLPALLELEGEICGQLGTSPAELLGQLGTWWAEQG